MHIIRTIPIILAISLIGCQPAIDEPSGTHDAVETPAPLDALDRGIAAHGGLDRWRSFGSLSFDLERSDRTEHHLIDLQSRKVLVTCDEFTIGYDGQDVWITPGMDAYAGSPRFYSSLQFYFFGLPFLLADPGTIREEMGTVSVDETTYDVVKVGYEEGIGDSPDDYYVAHFDSATGMLDFVLYTVTYNSREPNERYSARVFEWTEVQGLMVPSTISSYRWNNEEARLGEHRASYDLSNITFSPDRPDASLFAMPAEAEVDPLPADL